MIIKHLVLSGGGDGGYILYGALKYLSQNKYFNIENIETIHAVSIGALISVLVSLKYEWSELDDYIIKRPWHKVISIKLTNILNMWKKKGILDIEIIVKTILDSLLSAKGLSESITLKEFYEYNNIEIHMYTVRINSNSPILIDLSYKTYPDLELYKAISMSAAFPFIFSPVIYKNECFVDGGFINNFPINNCILNIENKDDNTKDSSRDNNDEILAFKLYDNIDNNPNNNPNNKKLIKDMEMHEYIYVLINKLFGLISINNNNNKQINKINLVICKIDNYCNFLNWNKAINDENIRHDMIKQGIKCGETYIKMKTDEANLNSSDKETKLNID